MDLNTESWGLPAKLKLKKVSCFSTHRGAAEILRQASEEGQKRFTDAYVSAHRLFMVQNTDGNIRLIHDGRPGGQNDWASLTAFTIGIDIVPAIACLLVRATRRARGATDLPRWFQMTSRTPSEVVPFTLSNSCRLLR